MPTYDYKCNQVDCGYRFEAVNRMRDKDLQRCPRCSGPCTSVPGIGRAPSVPRDWDEKEGKSLKIAFKPGSEAQLKKELGMDVPLTRDGAVHFTSDRQQKRLYRAMNSAFDRYAEQEQERLERRQFKEDDIKDAAAAIEQWQSKPGALVQ